MINADKIWPHLIYQINFDRKNFSTIINNNN